MAAGKSIRVYDLAREVKQDTKRVMEDLRREGADVSGPSNSVSHELAEKVRSKYFPKTEIAPKRGIKVIKKSAQPAEEAPVEVEEPTETEQPEIVAEPQPDEEIPVVQEDDAATSHVKKLTKKAVAKTVETEEKPKTRTVKAKTAEKETPAELEQPAEKNVTEVAETVDILSVGKSGNVVKTLKLTTDALKQGIKLEISLFSRHRPRPAGLLRLEQVSSEARRAKRPRRSSHTRRRRIIVAVQDVRVGERAVRSMKRQVGLPNAISTLLRNARSRNAFSIRLARSITQI